MSDHIPSAPDDRPDPTRSPDPARDRDSGIGPSAPAYGSSPTPPPVPGHGFGTSEAQPSPPPSGYEPGPSDAPQGAYAVPPPPARGFGQQGYGAAPGYVGPYGELPAGRNSKAVWALIIGIIGLLVCGVFLGPVAIYLSQQAKGEIARSGGRQTGAGMAQAGFVIGIIALIGWVITLIVRFNQMVR